MSARIALRRILSLAQAEVLHVVRDRATLAQILLMPLVQLLILPNAASFQIRDVPVYVVDLDRTAASRGLVARFAGSGYFRIVGASASAELANEMLLRGQATLALTIPADFEASLVRTGSAPVQLAIDAEEGTAAGIVQSYAARILAAYSAELEAELRPGARIVRADPGSTVQPAPGPGTVAIDVRMRGWYNPTLNYQHYMVPGILAALVTLVGTLLTAQNIARERELGTLEQLNVTPITRAQFITAKLLPFWVLALVVFGLGLLVGRLVFGIPMRGSLLLLFGVTAIYLIVALGLGLWISTLVETQQQAMFVTFFVVMIYFLMSGLFTPIDSMPRWVQIVAEVNPVRHFVAIARAVLVKGAGPAEILRPLGALVVLAVAVFSLAVRQYSKRVA